MQRKVDGSVWDPDSCCMFIATWLKTQERTISPRLLGQLGVGATRAASQKGF